MAILSNLSDFLTNVFFSMYSDILVTSPLDLWRDAVKYYEKSGSIDSQSLYFCEKVGNIMSRYFSSFVNNIYLD